MIRGPCYPLTLPGSFTQYYGSAVSMCLQPSQVPSELSIVELSLQMPRDGSVAPKFQMQKYWSVMWAKANGDSPTGTVTGSPCTVQVSSSHLFTFQLVQRRKRASACLSFHFLTAHGMESVFMLELPFVFCALPVCVLCSLLCEGSILYF